MDCSAPRCSAIGIVPMKIACLSVREAHRYVRAAALTGLRKKVVQAPIVIAVQIVMVGGKVVVALLSTHRDGYSIPVLPRVSNQDHATRNAWKGAACSAGIKAVFDVAAAGAAISTNET
jgi:hypothetical protein